MNVFEDALSKLKKTCLVNEDISFLENPEKVIITSFPARIKGKIKYFTGYRVQYNSLLGPTKGGLRFSPSVDLNDVKALALLMTLKNSLAGISYGGAKGGVAVNTKELSEQELENVTRGFTRSISKFIGKDIDIPAPDVYTNSQVMAWLLDEYETIKGRHEPGVVTGKPLILGGSKGRDKATALGAYYVIKNVAPKNNSVVIQGFGNAGMNLALILYKQGYKVIGVSDSRSGVSNKEGINIPELITHKKKTGSVKGFQSTNNVSNSELLELETNVLIPAAIENVITKSNAARVKAKMIVEVANGPVSNEADLILEKNGVLVYPDILCNSGGVIVSYYEWVQNNQGFYWTEEEVNEKLREKINDNLKKIIDEASKSKCSLRQAAYTIALKRLLEAKKLRGLN